MLYTKLGSLVAGIAFVLGILGIAMGIAVATGTIIEPEPGRYLGYHTSGEAIDRGIYKVFFAIALGVITEISRSIAKRDEVQQ